MKRPPLVALLALSACRLMGQGYGHGTAVAVIASPETIVAAIDSREVDREYLSDGSLVTEDRIACKVGHAGPYSVLVAGIARAGAFDALRETENLYLAGDSLDAVAEKLANILPGRLEDILNTLRAANRGAFEQAFRGRNALQLTLLGVEAGRPRVVVVTFRVTQTAESRMAIEAERDACPGNCADPNTIYMLGVHEEADEYLYANPQVAGDTSTQRAMQLIELEYASHPEIVGGPATVVRVTSGGVVLEASGACAGSAEAGRLKNGLDEAITALEDVMVHEDVTQTSKRGSRVRSGTMHASVRAIAGNEIYDWRDEFGNPETNLRRLPEPWCGGELTTMLRVTRLELEQGRGSVSADMLATEEALVVNFHSTAAERHWQLMVGSSTYPLAFEGRAWFSRETGSLLRIHWQTSELHLPTNAGITKIEWDETFSTSDIAGRSFLTPSTAMYRVRYASKIDRSDWTETRFSNFQRFGATASVRFE